jgi:hypothetical protein
MPTFRKDIVSIFRVEVKYEVLKAVRMIMMIFRALAPCRNVDRCKCLAEIYCLYLQEIASFCVAMTSTNESTRRQIPEEHHRPHCRESLKSHKNVNKLHQLPGRRQNALYNDDDE